MAWRLEGFVRSLGACSEATVSAYRSDVAGFTEWAQRAGVAGPEGVTRLMVRRYMAFLATRGLARRTIARKAASLRRYFHWLRRTGAVSEDPTVGLSAPKGEGRLPRVVGRSDMEDMLRPVEPAGGEEDRRAAAVALRDLSVIELLYGSGLRVSELCGLTPDDMDLDRRLVTVMGKGSKARQVPMSEPSVEAVRRWLREG